MVQLAIRLPTDAEFETYAYQEFIRRVLQAAESIRASDDFDLWSDDPASLAQWRILQERIFTDSLHLIDLCGVSGQPIIAGMEKVHRHG